MPGSAQDDIDAIDKKLKEIETRVEGLHQAKAAPGNEQAFAIGVSQLDADLKNCQDSRTKLGSLLKDLAAGHATADAVTAAIGTLTQAVSDLEASVAKSEALAAQG